jgi:antitoxin PrlF
MALNSLSSSSSRRPESAVPAFLDAESTLTDRYQTTIPETVRRALRLGKRDKIHYGIRTNGEVVLIRAEASEVEDAVLGRFLGFLAHDIASHPERLRAMDAGLVQRIRSLVDGIVIDHDAALSADSERVPARPPLCSFTDRRSLPTRCSSRRSTRWRGRSRFSSEGIRSDR